ncbi:MAG: hypothetical protein K9G76_10180 [Bacteroidales bacterium]|nr:hypothetical protein [Bacteroidales bacterium]MCF8404068.1 hypothetical protein [Bacteroidales bacterium]
MFRNNRKILPLLFAAIIGLLSSCSYQDREYDLEFQYDYKKYMPDETTEQMIYSDSFGNKLVFDIYSYDSGYELVFIDSDEGVHYYYYGNWRKINYSADGHPFLRYKYYIEHQYGIQVDVLSVQYGSITMNIALPGHYDDYNEDLYMQYANFLFMENMTINGQTYEDVYYRENLDGDNGIYYSDARIIAFKSEGIYYLLDQ